MQGCKASGDMCREPVGCMSGGTLTVIDHIVPIGAAEIT